MAYEAGLIGAAWSPQGHLLALATPDGVKVVDVSTGAVRWVAIDRCDQVTWYRP